jgi:mRNA interferase MazF
MKEGSIILTALPQSDGKIKLRPALILRIMPLFEDYLICGISTQISKQIEGFDEVIKEAELDFPESGLLKDSLIRLSFLAILPKKTIVGAIGNLSAKRYNRLIKNLSDYLLKGIITSP